MKFVQVNLVDEKGRICADKCEIQDLGDGSREYWRVWPNSGEEGSGLRATKFVARQESESQMLALGVYVRETINYREVKSISDVSILVPVVVQHHRALIKTDGFLKWWANLIRKLGRSFLAFIHKCALLEKNASVLSCSSPVTHNLSGLHPARSIYW